VNLLYLRENSVTSFSFIYRTRNAFSGPTYAQYTDSQASTDVQSNEVYIQSTLQLSGLFNLTQQLFETSCRRERHVGLLLLMVHARRSALKWLCRSIIFISVVVGQNRQMKRKLPWSSRQYLHFILNESRKFIRRYWATENQRNAAENVGILLDIRTRKETCFARTKDH
jgi:hypothetical protein